MDGTTYTVRVELVKTRKVQGISTCIAVQESSISFSDFAGASSKYASVVKKLNETEKKNG